ncbi:hypothetical protein HPB50_029038 [Hyalomma asiaticum]|nr:hypothetical protein HPB50_029038 [Hyalomma asiaticum]
MGSGGADFAASSRGNRRSLTEDTEYQVILPRLPTGQIVLNTVFLHGDVRVRPFRVEDFRDALEEVGMLPAVVALGAYQINHVWAVTLNSGEATKRLTSLKELLVKGRRCLVIDPQEQQVKIRLHWLLHGVADEDVRTALAAFGKVTEVEASQHCDGPNEAAAAPESWADCGRESASRQDEQDANLPQEDAPMTKDAVRGDSVSARVKRPLKAATQKCDGNLVIDEGEPPAKTPPVRRTERPESSEGTRASLSPRFPPCATELSDESYVAPSGR